MNHRTTALCALALLGVLMGSSTAGAQPKGGDAGSGWLSSLQEGKRQAGKTGKPIMVVLRCQP